MMGHRPMALDACVKRVAALEPDCDNVTLRPVVRALITISDIDPAHYFPDVRHRFPNLVPPA
jgi:hypothetical protein